MSKKHLFKIIPNSTVTGDSIGHLYCQTEPVHPEAMAPSDRKVKYIQLHRVIMENNLGYIIDANKYDIHHKDENPKNNALSNLELVDHAEHQEGHAKKHKRWKKNKFWKKSPRTKPGQARKVASAFLTLLNS